MMRRPVRLLAGSGVRHAGIGGGHSRLQAAGYSGTWKYRANLAWCGVQAR